MLHGKQFNVCQSPGFIFAGLLSRVFIVCALRVVLNLIFASCQFLIQEQATKRLQVQH